MSSGKLAAETVSFADFLAEWREVGYSLPKALDNFLRHAEEQGATAAAVRGLERLAERDRAVPSLF
jgi:hypothetical protein